MDNESLSISPKFEKNLISLLQVNPALAAQLFDLTKQTRYEILQGKDPIDINLLDKQTKELMYQSPLQNVESLLNTHLKNKLPFRYFFGMGTGILIQALLEQETIKRIVVIEPSLEILYIAFHLLDFSNHLINKKLIIEGYDDFSLATATILLNHHEGKLYARHFCLDTVSSYYEIVFMEAYNRVSTIITDAFYALIAGHGNCAIDSLMGISHHIKNLPLMVKNPKITQIKGKANADVAIVVSTGPSLSKQLPLLKKIQNHVTIICVDASFPILEKYGIKPDFVTVLERIPETAKFFKDNEKSFQDGVNFVLVSITHQDIIQAIRGGTKILQMRPHVFNKQFQLDEFGYLGIGMSAANLAHELGYLIGAKRIILIGQDLAFGEDNTSHAEGHLYGEDEEKVQGHEHFIEKYGGNGKIRTTYYWILFKNYFERTIAIAKGGALAPTINCTEGGARIPGSIEMPFSQAIEMHVEISKQKKSIVFEYPTKEEIQKYTEQYLQVINEIIKDSIIKQKLTEETFLEIQTICEKLVEATKSDTLNTITLEELIPYLDKIEAIKVFFHDDAFCAKYLEVVQTYIFSMELEMASIPLKEASTKEEHIEKVVEWIMKHRYWLFSLAGGIQAIRDTILQAADTWEDKTLRECLINVAKEKVE